MRIALFTVEGLPNARALRQFIHDHADEIVYIGASDTHRAQVGGALGQVKAHLSRSGIWIVPYLFVNFCLMEITRLFFSLLRPILPQRHIQEIPIEELCKSHNIPIHYLINVNHKSVIEAMTEAHVDIIISFHFDQIFKNKILNSVPLGGINVHPALLPHHRGPFPTFHALMAHDPLFGVTVHKLAAKIDAGNILEQTRMVLSPDITATRSAMVLFDEGRLCVERLLNTIKSTGEMPQGRPYPITAYYPWPSHEDMAKFYGMGRRMVNLGDVCEAISVS